MSVNIFYGRKYNDKIYYIKFNNERGEVTNTMDI